MGIVDKMAYLSENMEKEECMANVGDIANYIIGILDVTPLKLQKLLYYTQAVCLVKYNKPAFDDEIEAWEYGPVIRKIYDKYKGRRTIIKPTKKTSNLDKDVMLSTDIALAHYGEMSAATLIRETHSEDPWINAYEEGKDNIITIQSMKKYYKKIYTFEKNESKKRA